MTTSAQSYIDKIKELGLDTFHYSGDTIPEAKAAITEIRRIQRELRQIKREVNEDMKQIREIYREKSSYAGSGGSLVFEVLGKQKMAGQVRADAKRNLRSERDRILKPYANAKLAIDNMIVQLDDAKTKIQGVIDEVKLQEQLEKEQAEDFYESLLTTHLSTPSSDSQLQFQPEQFSVQKPQEPINNINYDSRPKLPAYEEYDLLAKVLGSRRKKIDESNRELQTAYEINLESWEETIQTSEQKLEEEKQAYIIDLEKWETQKAEFENDQELQRKLFNEKHLIDVEFMNSILSERIDALEWPLDTSFDYKILTDGKLVSVEVNLPQFENWPETKRSVTQKKKDYFAHVHVICFRVIGEVFFSLPSVNAIVISGYVLVPSKSTGQLENEYILSAKVDREKWSTFNFDNLEAIDVVLAFGEFEIRHKITSRGKIGPIIPFTSEELTM
jgi:hypothetical protein